MPRRPLRAGAARLDAGDARLVAGAALAIVALAAAAFGATSLLESDPPAATDGPSAADHSDHDQGDDHDGHGDETETAGHPLGAHGVADSSTGARHDDHASGGDHDTDDHAGDHSTGGGHDTGGDDDHGGHPSGTPTGAGHGHGTGSGTNQPAGPGHPHTTNPGHPHPTTPTNPDHPHPTTPTNPDHPHPTVPTDPDPTPDPGFDPGWTPEQVAYAQALIDETETQLERYDNVGVLPLLGYQWISDGKAVDEYQHWINLGRIADPDHLDPARPESLVLRTTRDGPVLEAAMYMLSLSYTMGNIPADIAWLPGWHIHDNLCFGPNYELYGVTVDGVCERGYVLPTPPMIHVWRVDTPCGRFAGVDEFGLQCDHEHDH